MLPGTVTPQAGQTKDTAFRGYQKSAVLCCTHEMKIGVRITLMTTALAVTTLTLYGVSSVNTRRQELMHDLEQETRTTGTSMQVTLEAALRDGLFQDLYHLISLWQVAQPQMGLQYVDIVHLQPGGGLTGFQVGATDTPPKPTDGGEQPATPPKPLPPDATRIPRLNRMVIEQQAIAEHLEENGHNLLVLAVPVRDENKRIVGALELRRDKAQVERGVDRSIRSVVIAISALGSFLALLIVLGARGLISSPLRRLLEAIDDVKRGDLGRVILRERDDEVGELSDRFNEMTTSLREAREQILAGVDTRLSLETKLRHSEKLATIGQLAAGIAHEVGTPLNVINGRARTMEKKAGEPAEVAKNAAIIAEQTARITKIIQQLLDFARRPQGERTIVDVGRVARGCLDFLEHQLSQRAVEVEFVPLVVETPEAPPHPIVRADSDQLQQVIINLLVNAMEAMTEGGRLSLTVRSLIRRRPGLDRAPEGPFVGIEVGDSGPGIPSENQERIFEPFFTTKGSGTSGGTGLGLAVSMGIVKDHEGWIEIDSELGRGTLFRVFLPGYDPDDSGKHPRIELTDLPIEE